MKDVTERALEAGAKTLTVTTGVGTSAGTWLDFLNGNAPAIGLLLTLIFGVISVYFQHTRNKKLEDSKDNALEIERLKQALKKMNEEKGEGDGRFN